MTPTGAVRDATVGSVMTRPVLTVCASDTCCDARRMLGDDWTGPVPVVSAQGLIVGVLRRAALDAACPSGLRDHWGTQRVAGLMDHRAVTVGVDDRLDHARDLMELRQVNRLPVVDGHLHVLGVLDRGVLPGPRRGASRLREVR